MGNEEIQHNGSWILDHKSKPDFHQIGIFLRYGRLFDPLPKEGDILKDLAVKRLSIFLSIQPTLASNFREFGAHVYCHYDVPMEKKSSEGLDSKQLFNSPHHSFASYLPFTSFSN